MMRLFFALPQPLVCFANFATQIHGDHGLETTTITIIIIIIIIIKCFIMETMVLENPGKSRNFLTFKELSWIVVELNI